MSAFVKFHRTKKDIDPLDVAKHKYYLNRLTPSLNLLTKVGINIVSNVAYLASFNSEAIFQLQKRASAIGICTFVSRIAIIFAPYAAKFQRPIPLCMVITINLICLAVSFTLPTKDVEEEA